MTAFVGLFGLVFVAWLALAFVRGLFYWIFMPRPIFMTRPMWGIWRGGYYCRGPMMRPGMYGRHMGPGAFGHGPHRGGMRF